MHIDSAILLVHVSDSGLLLCAAGALNHVRTANRSILLVLIDVSKLRPDDKHQGTVEYMRLLKHTGAWHMCKVFVRTWADDMRARIEKHVVFSVLHAPVHAASESANLETRSFRTFAVGRQGTWWLQRKAPFPAQSSWRPGRTLDFGQNVNHTKLDNSGSFGSPIH